MVLDETFLMPYEIADTPLTAGLKERGWWVNLSFFFAQRWLLRGLALCQVPSFRQVYGFQMISGPFPVKMEMLLPSGPALLSKQSDPQRWLDHMSH